MLIMKEWKPAKNAVLECGHQIQAGETGYVISLYICPAEAACLLIAVKTCLLAFRTLAEHDSSHSLLTRLKASLTAK